MSSHQSRHWASLSGEPSWGAGGEGVCTATRGPGLGDVCANNQLVEGERGIKHSSSQLLKPDFLELSGAESKEGRVWQVRLADQRCPRESLPQLL